MSEPSQALGFLHSRRYGRYRPHQRPGARRRSVAETQPLGGFGGGAKRPAMIAVRMRGFLAATTAAAAAAAVTAPAAISGRSLASSISLAVRVAGSPFARL